MLDKLINLFYYLYEMSKLLTNLSVPNLFNAKEVADYFGVTIRCVQNWIKQGKIEYYRIGRQPKFTVDQITRFLNSNHYNHKRRKT